MADRINLKSPDNTTILWPQTITDQVEGLEDFVNILASTITNEAIAKNCTFQTTAPTAAATTGGIHIVYLATEPTTYYAGYIYLIKDDA